MGKQKEARRGGLILATSASWDFVSTEYFTGRREVNQPGLKPCGSLPLRRPMARSICRRFLVLPHGCTPGEAGSRGRPLKRVKNPSYSQPFYLFPPTKDCSNSVIWQGITLAEKRSLSINLCGGGRKHQGQCPALFWAFRGGLKIQSKCKVARLTIHWTSIADWAINRLNSIIV